jgi:hypothetical protein
MSNLLYSQCERTMKNQAEWELTGLVPCQNEGLYFCRICNKKYCEDHLCSHLSSQYEEGKLKPAKPTLVQQASVDATLFGMEDDTKELGFIAYSEDELRTIPEIRLRGRHQRLYAELKRIQRELERRNVYLSELNAVNRRSAVMPGSKHSVPFGVSGFVKDVQQQARKDAKSDAAEKARQAKIQDALKVLSNALAQGQVSKSQLNSQVRKVK